MWAPKSDWINDAQHNDSFRIVNYVRSITLKTIIKLYGAYIFSSTVNDAGFVLAPTSFRNTLTVSKFFNSYTLNGNNYSNVQVIARDTMANHVNDIYKIILAKNQGIIGFEEYPSLALWVKEWFYDCLIYRQHLCWQLPVYSIIAPAFFCYR